MTTELLLLHAHVRIRDLEHALDAEQERAAALEGLLNESAQRFGETWMKAAHFSNCSRAWRRLAKRYRARLWQAEQYRARLWQAEQERDEARRGWMLCEGRNRTQTARDWAVCEWGADVAERLFPKEGT